MLFFAHSQGNLFVNKAYAHALGVTEEGGVKVVHVAPASPTLSGPYTLADKDLVINALRLVGAVVPNTTEIPGYLGRPAGLNGQRDLIGHGLLEIYLNSALVTASRIREQVMAAFRALDALPPRPFPDFIENAWQGGAAPQKVHAPDEVSHRLERIVEHTTKPRAFLREFWGWREIDVPDPAAPPGRWPEVSFSIQTFGPGMAGSKKCDWTNIELDGYEGWHSFWECTYDRMPRGAYISVPDELEAYKASPVGTTLYFNTLTNARPETPVNRPAQAPPYVRFVSGLENAWEDPENVLSYWSEPYQIYQPGAWLNEAEVRAWEAAYEAHRSAEAQRYARYLSDRKTYEEKCLHRTGHPA